MRLSPGGPERCDQCAGVVSPDQWPTYQRNQLEDRRLFCSDAHRKAFYEDARRRKRWLKDRREAAAAGLPEPPEPRWVQDRGSRQCVGCRCNLGPDGRDLNLTHCEECGPWQYCEHCEEPLDALYRDAKARWCEDCEADHSDEVNGPTCEACGKDLPPKSRRDRRTCSASCRQALRRREAAAL